MLCFFTASGADASAGPVHAYHPIKGDRCFYHRPEHGRAYYNCWPAPGSAPEPATTAAIVPRPLGPPFHWTLIFDDEFKDDASLNTNLWTPYWNTDGSTQNQTVMDSSNVSVSGGTLNLTLTASGTGAFVSTKGHFEFRYGYAEARIYLPPARNGFIANWPSWWAVGESWPADGELDIMEGLGGLACFYFHSDATRPGGCAGGIYTGWHTYGADWQHGEVSFYYDGRPVGVLTTGVTSKPMYLVLENSLPGIFGGGSLRPATMKVQYVRVWSGPTTQSAP